MNALPATAPMTRRARALRVFGITPWQLRAATPSIVASAAPPTAVPHGAACAVVLPAGCAARQLDLLGRALTAYGAELARAARITVADGQLGGALPAVRAYLVFGQAQAHALGRELPAAAMHQTQIVLVDEPAQVLGSAAGKRRLWSALRQLRRALAAHASG